MEMVTGKVEINSRAVSWAIGQRVGDPAVKAALMICAAYCDESGGLKIRNKDLAALCGVGGQTMLKKMEYLTRRGLLERVWVRRGRPTGDIAMHIRLNLPDGNDGGQGQQGRVTRGGSI